MDPAAVQLSYAIESVSGALASMTVAAHMERDASLAERYGAACRSHWTTDVTVRLRYLAQAIATECPDVLAEHLAWSMVANDARQVTHDDMLTNVACMREVIQSQLPDSAHACVTTIDAALSAADQLAGDPPSHVDPGNPHHQDVLRCLEALLERRLSDIEALVIELVERGTSIPDVYLLVLQPFLAEVGRLWHLGEATVVHEHMATQTVERLLSILRQRAARPPSKGRTLLATSISGDLHAVGVRMVADFFEMDGWNALVLGANTPASEILGALHEDPVDLLAVSMTNILSLRGLGELIAAIRGDAQLSSLPVIVGGSPFNRIHGLAEAVGADGSGESPIDAVSLGNKLAKGPRG